MALLHVLHAAPRGCHRRCPALGLLHALRQFVQHAGMSPRLAVHHAELGMSLSTDADFQTTWQLALRIYVYHSAVSGVYRTQAWICIAMDGDPTLTSRYHNGDVIRSSISDGHLGDPHDALVNVLTCLPTQRHRYQAVISSKHPAFASSPP